MGRAQLCFCYYKNTQLVFPLLFFLVSSITLVRFSAEGRAITKLHEAAQHGVKEEVVAMKSQIIGSRPPRCDNLCGNCGHCEAVQVPINTQAHKTNFSSSMASVAYSRGDGISNYKPMSWKCKCGNSIINP